MMGRVRFVRPDRKEERRAMGRFEARRSARSDAAVVALAGECDMSVCDELTSVLLAAVAECRVVVVDLAGLTFLDSSGIHALVMAHQAALREGGGLYAVGAAGVVADLLDLTGVADLLRAPDSGRSDLVGDHRDD
jgi:anti-sigma B factor antagonist